MADELRREADFSLATGIGRKCDHTSSAIFMVTNLVTKHFGFEEDWKKVGQMFEEWGKH